MDDTIYKKIFSKNLRRLMDTSDKSQTDIINDLGFTRSAVSSWVIGTRLPRMDKVDALANYFHCKRSDLIEDKPTPAAPSDVMDIVNQYGTDTPEQRAVLSAALDAVDIPAEKRELIQRILKMEPKQVAEVLELLQLADRMRQQ